MLRHIGLFIVLLTCIPAAQAAVLRVPADHRTIQAAIDAAGPGDTVLVRPGTYHERIRLRPGLSLRSEGDDAAGKEGLRRAETTILDGGGEQGKGPGVLMADGSSLDGFTVTNVGLYDEARWRKHHATQGDELDDEEGATHAQGTTPAVSVQGVNCSVTRCIIHHNGDVGIGVVGRADAMTSPLVMSNRVFRNMGGGIGIAEGSGAVVRDNDCYENLRAGIGCRKADPLIIGNRCTGNVRAGIGCREGAKPVIRGNECRDNRRAGIGIRMEGTAPIVEANHCEGNDMAGIGCRDGASPVLRGNRCVKNRMAGIGARDGAKPLILDNDCRENEMSGIGLQGQADATIRGNQCIDNKLVAIGVTDASKAVVLDNELSRTGGMPPLLVVKDGSHALIRGNKLTGGGVAAILLQGDALITGNQFVAKPGQSQALWIQPDSSAIVTDNQFNAYRTAINAAKAALTITGNEIRAFDRIAIVIKDGPRPAHVHGNNAQSPRDDARVLDLQGPAGVVADNALKKD